MIKIEVNVKNLKINYIKRGTGKTVLILPGWGTTIDVYMSLVNSISTYANVICFDMPGFGKSQEPESAWDLNDFVDFAIEFIKSQNIKELDLIGHSNGGRIIIRMLNRKTLDFKINKVILMGSAGIKNKPSFKVRCKIKISKIVKGILSLKLMKKILPNAIEKLQRRIGSEDYRNSPPILRQSMVKILAEDLTEELENIKVPTLLVWGEKDTATPIENAKIMKERIQNAGLVSYPNCSHYVFLERPIEVGAVIRKFIE